MKIVAVITLMLVPFSLANSGDCVAIVYGDYCLGADMNTFIQKKPPKKQRTKKGEKGDETMLLYREGKIVTVVNAIGGKIVQVSRTTQRGTWAQYLEKRQSLTKEYGNGIDKSSFPKYAKDPESIDSAIELGPGVAVARHVWKKGQLLVRLLYANVMYGPAIKLSYEIDSQEPISK